MFTLSPCLHPILGPMLWLKKILRKKWRYLLKLLLVFEKQIIITLVFEKNANFSAENWPKSQKLVIITPTPAWACGVVDRVPVCHLGDLGSNLGQANFLQWLMALLRPTQTPFHAPVSKLGGETPSRIRAWSLIRNEKPTVLFERHCHAT
jgi:hypothetical protein